jgi:peroxiredoxin
VVLIQLQRISNVFAGRDPATALIFAQHSLAFVQEQWPQSEEITEQHRVSCFWLPLLVAHSALKDWAASRRIGEALIKQIEDGSFSPELADETRIRKLYAEALQNTRLPEAARVQRELAADPSRNRKRREDQIRAALSTSEQRRPAVLFRLRDLNGNTTALTQLRGKAVVLTFWATWCGPCIAELEEWKTAWGKYRDNPDVTMLAISTDSDKGGVIGFAKERAYTFPILLTDGTIEEPYKTQTIPQLYVLDPAGNIRFQETGYSRDGFFLKKLDWMIGAVLK